MLETILQEWDRMDAVNASSEAIYANMARETENASMMARTQRDLADSIERNRQFEARMGVLERATYGY